MAQVSSGSFTTNASEGRSLTFKWSVDSTSIEDNFKKIYWSLVGSGSASGYVMAGDFKVVIDGETVYNSATRIQLKKDTVVASGYKILYHNTDGNKTFSASVQASIYEFAVDNKGSGTWELPTIPRYLNITQFDITDITENTILVKWATDNRRSRTYFSLDGGETWIGSATYGEAVASDQKSGSFNIQGLTANTAYNLELRIMRENTDLWSYSNTLAFQTYDYPHCTNTPNFTIGDALTLDFYNPLGRSITIAGYSRADGSEIFTGSTNGTRLVGFNDSQSVNKQYASIPKSQSSEYTVVVVYNDTPMTRDARNVYMVRGTEVPTINEVSYFDGNENVTSITHNASEIVQNLSDLNIFFHGATPNYGASGIEKYVVVCNGERREFGISGTFSVGTVDSERDVDLTFTAVDSRGLSASKTIKVTVLEHKTPNAVVTLQRLNNYEDETYLTVDGSVSSVNGKNTMAIRYRYRLSGGSYGGFTVIGDREKQTLSLDKNNVYVFEVFVTDAFGSRFVGEYTLGKGVFPFFIDTVKNSVGVNCFPVEEKSLEVNGFNMFNVYKCCKNILLGSSDGLKITVNNFANSDKIPLIIAGADNASMTPVFTVIHLRSDGNFSHINLGLDSAVTIDDNNLHINASQWSYFTVFAPLGADITLSNSAL